jgi:hypothetical protein
MMAQVGRIVATAAGSVSYITLDSGEKILVTHEPGEPGSPLRTFIASLDSCRSVAEVVACRQLLQ